MKGKVLLIGLLVLAVVLSGCVGNQDVEVKAAKDANEKLHSIVGDLFQDTGGSLEEIDAERVLVLQNLRAERSNAVDPEEIMALDKNIMFHEFVLGFKATTKDALDWSGQKNDDFFENSKSMETTNELLKNSTRPLMLMEILGLDVIDTAIAIAVVTGEIEDYPDSELKSLSFEDKYFDGIIQKGNEAYSRELEFGEFCKKLPGYIIESENHDLIQKFIFAVYYEEYQIATCNEFMPQYAEYSKAKFKEALDSGNRPRAILEAEKLYWTQQNIGMEENPELQK